MTFEQFPDDIRAAIEEVMLGTGLSQAEDPADLRICGIDDRSEVVRTMRGNLLRNVFLGGAFEKAVRETAMRCAIADAVSLIERGGLTREAWSEYQHLLRHLTHEAIGSIARDAIEPYIAALDDQGKYSRNHNPGSDFACIQARLAEDGKSD